MKTPEKGFIKLRKKAPKFLRNNFWRKVMAFLHQVWNYHTAHFRASIYH